MKTDTNHAPDTALPNEHSAHEAIAAAPATTAESPPPAGDFLAELREIQTTFPVVTLTELEQEKIRVLQDWFRELHAFVKPHHSEYRAEARHGLINQINSSANVSELVANVESLHVFDLKSKTYLDAGRSISIRLTRDAACVLGPAVQRAAELANAYAVRIDRFNAADYGVTIETKLTERARALVARINQAHARIQTITEGGTNDTTEPAHLASIFTNQN